MAALFWAVLLVTAYLFVGIPWALLRKKKTRVYESIKPLNLPSHTLHLPPGASDELRFAWAAPLSAHIDGLPGNWTRFIFMYNSHDVILRLRDRAHASAAFVVCAVEPSAGIGYAKRPWGSVTYCATPPLYTQSPAASLRVYNARAVAVEWNFCSHRHRLGGIRCGAIKPYTRFSRYLTDQRRVFVHPPSRRSLEHVWTRSVTTRHPIYYINRAVDTERNTRMLRKFNHSNNTLIRIEPVNSTDHITSLTFTFIRAIRNALRSGRGDLAFFFEDDVSLEYTPFWRMSLDAYVSDERMPPGWEMVQLGYTFIGSGLKPKKHRDFVYNDRLLYGSFAFAIHRRGMERVDREYGHLTLSQVGRLSCRPVDDCVLFNTHGPGGFTRRKNVYAPLYPLFEHEQGSASTLVNRAENNWHNVVAYTSRVANAERVICRHIHGDSCRL